MRTFMKRVQLVPDVWRFLRLCYTVAPRYLSLVVFVRLGKAFMPLGQFWTSKLVIDALVESIRATSIDTKRIATAVILQILFALISDGLNRLGIAWDALLNDEVSREIDITLILHATSLDVAQFEDPDFHDLLERAKASTGARTNLLTAIGNLIQETVTLFSLTIGFAVLSRWFIALLLVSTLPAFISDARFGDLRNSNRIRFTPARRLAEYYRWLGTSLGALKEVRLWDLGQFLVEKYTAIRRPIDQEMNKLITDRAAFGTAMHLISMLGYYGTYLYALSKALHKVISIGTFEFVALSFSRSTMSLERLGLYLNHFSDAALTLEDLFLFLDMTPNAQPIGNSLVPMAYRESFVFKDVSFRYPGAKTFALDSVNLEIRAGSKVAIVGENGSGKTTLVKLLTRMYDPSYGTITWGDKDIQQFDIRSYREQFSAVFQDFVHYELSLRESVGVGDLKSLHDDAAMERALLASDLSHLLGKLGDFSKFLGKRFGEGTELSGGEWQKLAIARAYFRSAPVLILDEPNASLDPKAEKRLYQHYAELFQGRTTVMISHRFASAKEADQILVLHHGKLVESGTHHSLMKVGGIYAELYNLQATAYR